MTSAAEKPWTEDSVRAKGEFERRVAAGEITLDEVARIDCPRGRELRVCIAREVGRYPVVSFEVWRRSAPGEPASFRSSTLLEKGHVEDVLRAFGVAQAAIDSEMAATFRAQDGKSLAEGGGARRPRDWQARNRRLGSR